MSDRDDWSDYDSGPYCMHWCELYSCRKICERCGHACHQHSHAGDDYTTSCQKFFCRCPEWQGSTRVGGGRSNAVSG